MRNCSLYSWVSPRLTNKICSETLFQVNWSLFVERDLHGKMFEKCRAQIENYKTQLNPLFFIISSTVNKFRELVFQRAGCDLSYDPIPRCFVHVQLEKIYFSIRNCHEMKCSLFEQLNLLNIKWWDSFCDFHFLSSISILKVSLHMLLWGQQGFSNGLAGWNWFF